jgi:hypothetical protein
MINTWFEVLITKRARTKPFWRLALMKEGLGFLPSLLKKNLENELKRDLKNEKVNMP